MTSLLTWPAGILPTSESWVIENADRSGGVSITGSEQVVGSGGGRWRAKLAFVLFREEAPVMRALLASMRGRSRSVLVGPFDLIGMPQPTDGGEEFLIELGALSEVQDGQPPFGGAAPARLAAPADLRATSIVVAGPRPLTVGLYIGIQNRLHIVTSVQRSGGTDLCEIEPPLRSPAAADTPIVFDRPLSTMRLATQVDALSVDGATFQTTGTLDLVEDF